MASKKKKSKCPNFSKNSGIVFRMSSEEATLAKKPYYNGFSGGYGAHGDRKYNRTKENRDWRRSLGDE